MHYKVAGQLPDDHPGRHITVTLHRMSHNPLWVFGRASNTKAKRTVQMGMVEGSGVGHLALGRKVALQSASTDALRGGFHVRWLSAEVTDPTCPGPRPEPGGSSGFGLSTVRLHLRMAQHGLHTTLKSRLFRSRSAFNLSGMGS